VYNLTSKFGKLGAAHWTETAVSVLGGVNLGYPPGYPPCEEEIKV